MSKLQTSIEKALEKHRTGTPGGAGVHSRRADDASSSNIGGIASGIFRKFQFAVPRHETMEESRIVPAVDDQMAKTAYNVLRTRALHRIRSQDWHSILVTSPGPGEGKTVTAANLAISLARDVNQSAILVDLDLTRSSVAKYLGIQVDIKAGVGDFLLGNAEISDIIYSPGEIERLALVPNREPVDNASDLLGSPRMKELVANLRAQSSKTVVIYDMPPILACDDVLAFCPNIDAILMVVAQGKTERLALEKAMSMLSGYEMLGVVLNMSDESAGDNAYAYY